MPTKPAHQTPVSKQSSEQLTDSLINSRGGARTAIAYGATLDLNDPHIAKDEYLTNLTIKALQKTVENGWYVDFPDVLLALQHKTATVEASVATLTNITNMVRDSNRKAANGHYYIGCKDDSKCVRTPPTRDELNRALGAAPITPAMNENHAVQLTNAAVAEIAYLAASQNPVEFLPKHEDGSRQGFFETVDAWKKQIPETATRGAFKDCIQSTKDDDLQVCLSAAARTAFFDRAKRVGGNAK